MPNEEDTGLEDFLKPLPPAPAVPQTDGGDGGSGALQESPPSTEGRGASEVPATDPDAGVADQVQESLSPEADPGGGETTFGDFEEPMVGDAGSAVLDNPPPTYETAAAHAFSADFGEFADAQPAQPAPHGSDSSPLEPPTSFVGDFGIPGIGTAPPTSLEAEDDAGLSDFLKPLPAAPNPAVSPSDGGVFSAFEASEPEEARPEEEGATSKVSGSASFADPAPTLVQGEPDGQGEFGAFTDAGPASHGSDFNLQEPAQEGVAGLSDFLKPTLPTPVRTETDPGEGQAGFRALEEPEPVGQESQQGFTAFEVPSAVGDVGEGPSGFGDFSVPGSAAVAQEEEDTGLSAFLAPAPMPPAPTPENGQSFGAFEEPQAAPGLQEGGIAAFAGTPLAPEIVGGPPGQDSGFGAFVDPTPEPAWQGSGHGESEAALPAEEDAGLNEFLTPIPAGMGSTPAPGQEDAGFSAFEEPEIAAAADRQPPPAPPLSSQNFGSFDMQDLGPPTLATNSGTSGRPPAAVPASLNTEVFSAFEAPIAQPVAQGAGFSAFETPGAPQIDGDFGGFAAPQQQPARLETVPQANDEFGDFSASPAGAIPPTGFVPFQASPAAGTPGGGWGSLGPTAPVGPPPPDYEPAGDGQLSADLFTMTASDMQSSGTGRPIQAAPRQPEPMPEPTGLTEDHQEALSAIAECHDEVTVLERELGQLIRKGRVDSDDYARLNELLTRQLLRLDAIMGGGAVRVARKQEVVRLNKLCETLEAVKPKQLGEPSTQPLPGPADHAASGGGFGHMPVPGGGGTDGFQAGFGSTHGIGPGMSSHGAASTLPAMAQGGVDFGDFASPSQHLSGPQQAFGASPVGVTPPSAVGPGYGQHHHHSTPANAFGAFATPTPGNHPGFHHPVTATPDDAFGSFATPQPAWGQPQGFQQSSPPVGQNYFQSPVESAALNAPGKSDPSDALFGDLGRM